MSFRDDILKKIATASDLPSLPDIVLRLSRMVADRNTSAADIARVVQYDPAISGRILRLANSAAFGGAVRIASIPQAVMRVGFKGMRDLVLSLAVIRAFGRGQRIHHGRFWRHSLAVGFAAQIVERHAAKIPEPSDEAFTAGLLHDLGVLIMDWYASEPYSKVVAYAHHESKDLVEVEQEVLGIDHAEGGGHLLAHWNVPAPIAEAARYHHQPGRASVPSARLCQVVHLANFACNNQGIDNGVGTFPSRFVESAWFDTGLSVDDIPALIAEVNQQTAAADEIISAAQ